MPILASCCVHIDKKNERQLVDINKTGKEFLYLACWNLKELHLYYRIKKGRRQLNHQ